MALTGGWVVEQRAVWAIKRNQSIINLVSQSGVRGGVAEHLIAMRY